MKLTKNEKDMIDAQASVPGPQPTPRGARLGLRFAVLVAVAAGLDREALLDEVAADYDEIKKRGR